MNNSHYFKDIIESIPNYRKIVLLIYLIQNDKRLLEEIGFSKKIINSLNLEFNNVLINKFDEYLSYIKNQEESNLEYFLDK